MKNEIARLERAVGLVRVNDCTPQEDAYYAQMLRAGKPLPAHIKPDGYRIVTKLEKIRFWVSFPYILARIAIGVLLVIYGILSVLRTHCHRLSALSPIEEVL